MPEKPNQARTRYPTLPSASLLADRGIAAYANPLVTSGRAEAVDLADQASFALARPGLAQPLRIAVVRERARAGASALRADLAGP